MTSNEIMSLANTILYHKRKYYDGEPEISDEAYDSLEEKLRKLDPVNPVLFIVGTPEGGKITHDVPMLSCQKALDVEEVLKWSQGYDLFIEYKIDGLSLSLTYNEGRLVQAATRGNGVTGDDTTIVTMKLKSIPKTIPVRERIFIRGEIFIHLSEFQRINALGTESYSSPRNLAVGTIKQKDLSLLDKRKLEFFAFELIGFEEDKTLSEKANLLQEWGFQIAKIESLTTPSKENLSAIFLKTKREREILDFEIDGLVLKYNKADERNRAGMTAHHPKWMIALKFESKGKITTINDITWQLGRTGVLTPVAELTPIDVSGAMIRRATLHNREFVETLDVAVGDQVMVIRSGDVIPKITSVERKGQNLVTLPKECPSCGFLLIKEGVNLVCKGQDCKEREIQKIRHWIKTIDIKGLGLKNIEKLYDSGYLKHFSDLYDSRLTETKLVSLLGKNGSKIYQNIQQSRSLPFQLFLAGLGIESLGLQMGRILAKYFNSWDELESAKISQLVTIEGVSDLTAGYIIEGIHDPSLGKALLDKGVSISITQDRSRSAKSAKNDLLNFIGKKTQEHSKAYFNEDHDLGKKRSIYVTGKVPEMTKKDIKDFLEKNNYEWASLTKSLDLLVTGEKPGSTKLEKAKKYGIPIKTWDEFQAELP
ncbi:DNA ligase (NAD(+)) LigA [Candidatus Heimdallarchaeota archaeon B3_Heim]|nr:MAG: DNA ligase (NAD(+)) LigA [Candidatus Heimdallarchaeota archaeon B3_Heim]